MIILALIGLDKLHYSKIKEASDGTESYTTPKLLAKAIKADLSIELAEMVLYADDGVSEIVKDFKSGKLSLGVDDIGTKAAQDLTGAMVDDNGVLISASENDGTPVAVRFRALKPNNKFRCFWFYRVKFGIPSGKHPWKSEVAEGETGVNNEVISVWFETVYEPEFRGGEND